MCVLGLQRFRMHLRLPESRRPAGSFVPVRRGLQLRPDVHLQRLPARERTSSGEPVMHADTGLLAVMGSICMMLALVLAWCLQESGHHGSSRSADRASVRLLSAL